MPATVLEELSQFDMESPMHHVYNPGMYCPCKILICLRWYVVQLWKEFEIISPKHSYGV